VGLTSPRRCGRRPSPEEGGLKGSPVFSLVSARHLVVQAPHPSKEGRHNRYTTDRKTCWLSKIIPPVSRHQCPPPILLSPIPSLIPFSSYSRSFSARSFLSASLRSTCFSVSSLCALCALWFNPVLLAFSISPVRQLTAPDSARTVRGIFGAGCNSRPAVWRQIDAEPANRDAVDPVRSRGRR